MTIIFDRAMCTNCGECEAHFAGFLSLFDEGYRIFGPPSVTDALTAIRACKEFAFTMEIRE